MHLLGMRVPLKGVTAAMIAFCVAACGGGGGSGNSSPNPLLGTLAFSTNENVALPGHLTATDPADGAVTFSQVGNPASGAVTGFTAAGAFVYTPKANFTGSDSFKVEVTDASGHTTMGTVSITVTVNHPPTANNTIIRADGAALADINVLGNASDPDKDPLTVTIVDPALVGTASVNPNGSVSITALPSGFKGLTRFKYQVTDPSGASAVAWAAIFVGAEPFRAAFVADAAGNGSYEVYLTDFAANPVKVTTATQGNLRLKGFAVSDNGAAIVYRTQDTTNAATTSLSFVRTATPTTQAIPLPGGIVPVTDASGKDQFVVSPDGNWIAMIAGQGSISSLYVLNVTNPTVVSQILPSGAVYATRPTFTPDSKNIYFLAASVTSGAAKSLYFAALNNPSATTLVSAASDPAKNDDISAYSVSSDQTRIVTQATRNGGVGLFFIDPAHLQTENQLNQAPGFGLLITTSTVGLLPGMGGSTTLMHVAYDVGDSSNPDSVGIYVADVPPATPPSPQIVAPLEQVIGFSPDDTRLLYTDTAQVFEIASGPGNTGTQLGEGTQAWYDSTGNVVLLQKPLASGGSTLAYNTRPFATPQPVTPNGTAAYDVDVSGFSEGVVILGQASSSGAAPTTTNLQIVNALAPDDPFALMSLESPLQLTSYVSKVVSAAVSGSAP
jgi:Bacterial Ig domain/WD40-like Beta Propeller Repeat